MVVRAAVVRGRAPGQTAPAFSGCGALTSWTPSAGATARRLGSRWEALLLAACNSDRVTPDNGRALLPRSAPRPRA